MSSKLKNIFSIFSLKKKSVPREEPLPSSILSYILICFDYINKFNSNQVQRLYAIPKNKLPVHTPHKESYDLMDTMLNDTFNESIMKRLFDPFIIIEAIQLVLKKFEPIITYPLIKELVIQRNKNYSIILKNLSTEHSNFLKYLMLHIEILLKNGTAERLDLMTIFSELVLDPHPNDCNHGDESKVALEVFIEIYDNWREILEVADEIIDGGTIDHIPDVTVTEYSIQDRTVKISFPKGEYEENMITKNQLTKILSNFGEISEIGWKEKFCLLSFKDMESVLNCLDEWEDKLPEGYKVKAFGIVPTREEFEVLKKKRNMSPQRHVLPTYSEYIKSLPTPKRLNVEKTVNNIQDAPHSPPTLDALSPRTKESKKDMYRNMHHESSPAPSDHGMDDDDTFDSEGGYDDHGVTHLSNRANALLSRISTADESDESPRNTSTPLISPRKSQSQRSLGQSAPILSISNEVSAIHVNKSMNNTIEVQDFLSVDSMSEGGDAENSKSRYHTSSPNSELPLESDTNPPTVSEEKDNEIKPRIISKKQATVIGVNRVAETETIPVSQQLSSSRNLTVTDSSSKWIVATKAEKADSHLQQDSHENLQNLELSSDVNIMSTSIIQNEQRNDAQKNNQDSLDLGDYVFPNDSDTDDSVIDQHLESRERSHSVEVDKVHEFPDISRSQVLQDSSSLTINDSKTTENGKLRSVSQDIVPILNFSSQQMAQPIRENPVERVQLQQISENQKASIVEILQPSSPKYHDQVQSSHHADHESVMDSQIRYHRNMPITSSTAPDYQMEQMIQRIRILEAESRARREQLLLDEEKYKLSESAWSGEIVSLKVYIKDIEAKLQEERSRNRKLLSEVASRDAEIASLTSTLESLKLVVNNAKESADREALSTVLAQQRLIKMLERQRNAETEKVQLLQAEVQELRAAHEKIVNEMIDHNMESETKRDSKPLGPKRSAVVVVEDIDSNDQDDDHSVQIQPVIPNDLLSSNHPEEIFEEKLEDDLEDIHDRPAVRDNISSQVPEPRSKYESDKTHLPEKEMSGVNLNEVSAIRAAAQAQIERYLEKRSEKNKAIARNKQTTSLSGKVESSGRQTSVTPNLPKSTNTKDFISRSEPLQGKSSPQESKSRDPMEQNNRIESILARENRKFQESMKPQQELSNQLTQNLLLSQKDLLQLPQKMKFHQTKQSNPSNPYYDAERDAGSNHIVMPPKLPFGHPLESSNPYTRQSIKSNYPSALYASSSPSRLPPSYISSSSTHPTSYPFPGSGTLPSGAPPVSSSTRRSSTSSYRYS